MGPCWVRAVRCLDPGHCQLATKGLVVFRIRGCWEISRKQKQKARKWALSCLEVKTKNKTIKLGRGLFGQWCPTDSHRLLKQCTQDLCNNSYYARRRFCHGAWSEKPGQPTGHGYEDPHVREVSFWLKGFWGHNVGCGVWYLQVYRGCELAQAYPR